MWCVESPGAAHALNTAYAPSANTLREQTEGAALGGVAESGAHLMD